MEHYVADLTILYGSQTGNAEDMAKRIGMQAKLHGFINILVTAIDDFQLKLLPKQKFVLFVCATTGHGQEPENMKNFYNFIRRRDLPSDCLKNLKYAVYGLGSSSYAKFNYVSKILFKRIKECGASHIQDLVASDEQHRYGCDGLIYPQLQELWLRLGAPKSKVDADVHYESSYDAEYHDVQEELSNGHFRCQFNVREAKCLSNERLTAESHFQDTRLIKFIVEGNSNLEYEPGDVCTIYPENSEENVKEFICMLGLDPNQRFSIRKKDPNYMVNYLYDYIPKGCTVDNLVRKYLDIQSVPKRSFFEYLWQFSEDDLERDKLKEFASTEGQAELYEYCIRPKRSILETMKDFPKTVENIKFSYLLDLIPPIKPRSFSIASSVAEHPNQIHLLIGVVDYKTTMRKPRRGLCSNYLATRGVSDEIRFFISRTSFKMPQDMSTPIIMIGPGLGLSPFLSFTSHMSTLGMMQHHQKSSEPSQARTEIAEPERYLYFGCRYKDKDFYLREKLEAYHSDGLIRLRVAFSRDAAISNEPERGEKQRRVQDLIRWDECVLKRLICQEGAIIYIAGNSKLPEELRALFAELLSSNDGDDDGDGDDNTTQEIGLTSPSSSSLTPFKKEATTKLASMASHSGERMVAQLEASNRIQYDCW